jgi:type IV pilus assembly protein PilY1
MNKLIVTTIFALLVAMGLPATVLGGADEYIGDAAIYTLLGATGGVKPNVLFIIDNSHATENVAVGYAYDPNTEYDGPYNRYDIHVGDNQGDFDSVMIANADANLTGLTCATAVVKDSLLDYGSYAGAGHTAYPNINKNTGGCATGPKGEVYVLGNYLNYLNTSPAGATGGSDTSTDTCVSATTIVVEGDVRKNPSTWKKYQLVVSHTAAADNKPVSGANWGSYWQEVHHNTTPTHTWTEGIYYTTGACPDADTGTETTTVSGTTQRQVIYNALETVLSGARYAANFGAMTYGGNNSGGDIIVDGSDSTNTTDMADLTDDTAFNNFLALLPGSASGGAPVLSSNTGRPQSEALYDAGYYFNAPYANIRNTKRVPSAFDNTACGNTHVILITNGLSNGDGSPKLGTNIGDWDNDGWADESVYGEGSHYLDDVASYLKGEMDITTHTVLAFQSRDVLIEHAAETGEGQFYNVYDANSLAKALQELIVHILLESNSVFVAPVVPSNPENRTFSGSRIYLGLFRTVEGNDWIGNLKKYGIGSDGSIRDYDGTKSTSASGDFKTTSTSFWTNTSLDDGGEVAIGGIGGKLLTRDLSPSASSPRMIYSNLDASESDLTATANRFDLNILPATIGLTAGDTAARDELVNYVYGLDAYDDDGDGITAEAKGNNPENERPNGWVLGDILHSKPAIINFNTYNVKDLDNLSASHSEDICPSNWSTDFDNVNKTVIFVSTNDGLLHAFSDCNGSEMWAYIPDNLLTRLPYLHDATHSYFADASATVYTYDKSNDGKIGAGPGGASADDGSDDRAILIIGQRRGGGLDTNADTAASFGGYYALDVTNPNAPKFLWKIDRTVSGFGELGETFSMPNLGKVKVSVSGTDVTKIVGFIGAGYDNLNEDGRFGHTQLFSDTDVGAITSDSGFVTSSGTVAAGGLTNNPKGRGIFAFEIATLNSGVPTIATSPTLVWSFTPAHSYFSAADLDFSFPTDIAVVDMNFDGYADRLYAGDTGGNVWRFSAHHESGVFDPYADAHIANWTAKRVFDANFNATTSGRKFFYRPSVVIQSGYVGLVLGTGDRAHPLNRDVTERIFAVKDKGQLHNDHIAVDDLVDVTLLGDPSNPETPASGTCASSDTANQCIRERLNDSSYYGWFIDAPNSGEKFLASPLVFNGVAYLTSYTPEDTTAGSCTPGNLGTSRVYALDYLTGAAAMNFNSGNDNADGTEVIDSTDRSNIFGEGIPPEITVTIPDEGDPRIILPKPDGIEVMDAPPGGLIWPLYWWQK